MLKCSENTQYPAVLKENHVDGQIPQNGVWIIQVPAVVDVPVFVLSDDAGAKSRIGEKSGFKKNKNKLFYLYRANLSQALSMLSRSRPHPSRQLFLPCYGMFQQMSNQQTY